jgi:hypothetical protein
LKEMRDDTGILQAESKELQSLLQAAQKSLGAQGEVAEMQSLLNDAHAAREAAELEAKSSMDILRQEVTSLSSQVADARKLSRASEEESKAKLADARNELTMAKSKASKVLRSAFEGLEIRRVAEQEAVAKLALTQAELKTARMETMDLESQLEEARRKLKTFIAARTKAELSTLKSADGAVKLPKENNSRGVDDDNGDEDSDEEEHKEAVALLREACQSSYQDGEQNIEFEAGPIGMSFEDFSALLDLDQGAAMPMAPCGAAIVITHVVGGSQAEAHGVKVIIKGLILFENASCYSSVCYFRLRFFRHATSL